MISLSAMNLQVCLYIFIYIESLNLMALVMDKEYELDRPIFQIGNVKISEREFGRIIVIENVAHVANIMVIHFCSFRTTIRIFFFIACLISLRMNVCVRVVAWELGLGPVESRTDSLKVHCIGQFQLSEPGFYVLV